MSRKALTKMQVLAIIVLIVVVIVGGIAYYLLTPTGRTPTEEIPRVIRFGTVQHLSGSLAIMGQYALIGLEVGVQWVNDQGGVNFKGHKIPVELIYYDDETNLDYAVKLTEKLITEDKVQFFTPPWTPEFVVATVPVAEKHGIVSISPGGGSDVEFQQGFKYMIQCAHHGSSFFDFPLKVLHEQDPSAKRIAFIYSSADVGGTISTAAHINSKKWGFEIVYEKMYPEDISDASSMLREIAALSPPVDILLGGTFPASGMLIASQLKELRIYFKYILLEMVTNRVEFGQTFGKYAAGFFVDTVFEPECKWEVLASQEGKEYVGPTNDELVQRFRQSGRTERIRTEVGMGATAPVIIKKCIEVAQSLRSDDIIKAALSLDVYTCVGLFKLDPENPAHQIGLLSTGIVMQWQKKGDKLVYAIVYPYIFKTADLIPMPTWKEKDSWPELTLEIK